MSSMRGPIVIISIILVPILVPRAHDPSGLWQGSRALAGPNFLSMRRVFVSNSQPIRFARFDNKSVNRGLPVLDKTRALDPCHRPEGSWALGTRMSRPQRPRSFWSAPRIAASVLRISHNSGWLPHNVESIKRGLSLV